MRTASLLALVLVCAVRAWAQEPIPTHATVSVVQADSPTAPPLVQATYPFSLTDCGFSAPTIPPPPIVNPAIAAFEYQFSPGQTTYCRLALPPGIPEGLAYRAVVYVTATPCQPGGSASCDSLTALSLDSFAVQTTPDCTGQVVLDIGDWPRRVQPKEQARVQFSLRRSTSAVTAVRLFTRPVGGTFSPTDDPVAGSDLRRFSGVYFTLPITLGRYEMQVVAENSAGCTAGSDRPMNIEVK